MFDVHFDYNPNPQVRLIPCRYGGVTVFQYQDYRAFIRDRFAELSGGGRGQISSLAAVLGVSASLVGRILKGTKDFTEEQAVTAAIHLGLDDNEADYFLALVQFERAGTPILKEVIRRRMNRDRTLSVRKGTASVHANELRPQDQAVFYSGWDFSAVRLISELPEFRETDRLASKLGISVQRVKDILDFLVQTGLSVRTNGSVQLGPTKTIIDKTSPHLQRHHINWRIKALEAISRPSGSDQFYTAPMTIRKSDVAKLRKLITALTDRAEKCMEVSDPDMFCCLLIDWFSI